MRKLLLSLAVAAALTGSALAQPITRRVVGTSQLKSDTEVIIDAGTDDGVTRTWKVYFVDNKGNPIPDGELTLIRIDKKIAVARTSIPAKEVARYKVHLEP